MSISAFSLQSFDVPSFRWSDQGAFTGVMTSIHLRFTKTGVRWFDGKTINQNFEDLKEEKFGYLFQDNSDDSDSSEASE